MDQATYWHNWRAAKLMGIMGGAFVSSLGACYQHADLVNAEKLVNAFPEFFQRYAQLAQVDPEAAKRATERLQD